MSENAPAARACLDVRVVSYRNAPQNRAACMRRRIGPTEMHRKTRPLQDCDVHEPRTSMQPAQKVTLARSKICKPGRLASVQPAAFLLITTPSCGRAGEVRSVLMRAVTNPRMIFSGDQASAHVFERFACQTDPFMQTANFHAKLAHVFERFACMAIHLMQTPHFHVWFDACFAGICTNGPTGAKISGVCMVEQA